MLDRKTLEPFMKRLNEALEAMDALASDDRQEDLCAEAEDLLFFIESIDPREEDAAEELADTLDQLSELLDEAEPGTEFAAACETMRGVIVMLTANV